MRQLTIGGTPITAVEVGGTPITEIWVGETLIWSNNQGA